MNTETLEKLFLELSSVVSVSTPRENGLRADLKDANEDRYRLTKERDRLLAATKGLLTCSLPKDVSGRQAVEEAIAAVRDVEWEKE